jgi:protein TonB
MLRKIFYLGIALIIASCTKMNDDKAKSINTPVTPKFELKKESYSMMAEKMPEIIGGLESIQKKVTYPEEAIKNKIEGTVYVLAYVNENGDVYFVEVLKGIGYGCDESAKKAVLETKFKPAYNQGKPVKVRIVIPIRFKLSK